VPSRLVIIVLLVCGPVVVFLVAVASSGVAVCYSLLPIAEPNAVIRASYFLLNEHMRFLDCSTGGQVPSVSIFDDLPRALSESDFAPREFKMRDGNFHQHMQARPPAAALAVALEEGALSASSLQKSTGTQIMPRLLPRAPRFRSGKVDCTAQPRLSEVQMRSTRA
jgi:hypothetical protein